MTGEFVGPRPAQLIRVLGEPGGEARRRGEYLDDSVITTKVKAAIFHEPSLKSSQISIRTHEGIVQLSGFVDSAESVQLAGKVAASVQGVSTVRNDLIVK